MPSRHPAKPTDRTRLDQQDGSVPSSPASPTTTALMEEDPMTQIDEILDAEEEADAEVLDEESLVEEISIDGMCGVY